MPFKRIYLLKIIALIKYVSHNKVFSLLKYFGFVSYLLIYFNDFKC